MYLLTINRSKNLIVLNLIGDVTAEELRRANAEGEELLSSVSPGAALIADFTNLSSMPNEAAPEVGKLMELCEKHSVGIVARIFPDPSRDIGMNILARFHYHHPPRIITCQNLAEALRALDL